VVLKILYLDKIEEISAYSLEEAKEIEKKLNSLKINNIPENIIGRAFKKIKESF
jgi:hypothetical protein